MEDGRRHDENGRVHKESERQRAGRVYVCESDSFSFPAWAPLVSPGLNDGGVQIQVMRHDRSAKDRDRDVQHVRVGKESTWRFHEAHQQRSPLGPGKRYFDPEQEGDGTYEHHHDGLQVAKAAMLQEQDQKNVDTRDDDSGNERDAEEKLESDGRADDFSQIAGCNRNLCSEPQKQAHGPAVILPAHLGKVALRRNT